MKKIIAVFLVLISLCICFSCVARAEDGKGEIKDYIEEKIAPVVIGVLTGIIGLISSIGTIKKAVNSLKDTKEILHSDSLERAMDYKRSKELISQNEEKIKTELDNTVKALKEKMAHLEKRELLVAKVISLGFASNSDVVRSGRAAEMAKLVSQIEGDYANEEN